MYGIKYSNSIRIFFQQDFVWPMARVRVDLEVIVMKGYSMIPGDPELEPHYQTHFNVILRTTLCGGANPYASKCIPKSSIWADELY